MSDFSVMLVCDADPDRERFGADPIVEKGLFVGWASIRGFRCGTGH